MSFKTGISSACFYPLDTVKSLETCAAAGFDTAEIFINTDSEMSGGYYRDLCSFVRGAHMDIVSVHPFTSGYENVLFFAGYERRISDGIEYYKKYFDFAASLGARFVVFHGNNMKNVFCGFEKYAEIFRRINSAAHEFGVELIHENTTWCIARDAEGVRGLRRACPEMKFVFDAKQACRGGYDPYAVLEAMGESAVHFHFNDWINGRCAPPFSGTLDIPRIISSFRKNNYEGAAVIEVYRENFSDVSELVRAKDIFEERKSAGVL